MIELFFSFQGVGWGDVTYNPRRNILAAISISGEVAYHLFSIETTAGKRNYSAKLLTKAKCHPQHNESDLNVFS